MNLGTYLLPAVLPVFEAMYPGIQVRFRENNSSELGRMAAGKKVDFAIMHFQEQQEELGYELFSEDPFYLVAPAAWRKQLPFAPPAWGSPFCRTPIWLCFLWWKNWSASALTSA